MLNGRAISFDVKDSGKQPIRKDGDIVIPGGARHRAMDIAGRQEQLNAIDNGAGKVEWLLQKESELSKDIVGPPFTIFRLSPIGGSSWMKGAEQCKVNTHLTAAH